MFFVYSYIFLVVTLTHIFLSVHFLLTQENVLSLAKYYSICASFNKVVEKQEYAFCVKLFLVT